MGLTVVIEIGVTGGVDAVYGPFKTSEDAISWAHDFCDVTWCTMPLLAQEGNDDR